MIKLTKDKIREIYQELDCGMRCFYNPEKDDIISMPDMDTLFYAEKEMWEDVITDVDSNIDKYIEFEKMPSNRSFELMIEFTETIGDNWLQKNLINVLNKRKPFHNFKFLIDNSEEYRLKWFEYKEKKYCEWLESQIDDFNKIKKPKKTITRKPLGIKRKKTVK